MLATRWIIQLFSPVPRHSIPIRLAHPYPFRMKNKMTNYVNDREKYHHHRIGHFKSYNLKKPLTIVNFRAVGFLKLHLLNGRTIRNSL